MADIEFVEVVATGPGWNRVLASDGNTYTFKGDYNWRSNNPGNIEYGPFAISQGAIGSGAVPPNRQRGFAIFPTYEAGEKARTVLQFESPRYRDKTIAEAISIYAPDNENDTQGYIAAVTNAAGVSPETKMSDLSAAQRKAFLNAQRRVEGFRPGTIQGDAGKPVPAAVVEQFRGAPVPPVNVGPAPTPATRSASVRASQVITPPSNGGIPLPRPRPDTAPQAEQLDPLPTPAPLEFPAIPAKTATLPSGKPVEVGRVYQVGGERYIGGVDETGAGTLNKIDTGILGEAGSGSIVGGIVDDTLNETIASGIRQVRPAATAAIDAIGSGASGLLDGIGGLIEGATGGGEKSPALASALARLGAAVAAKGSVSLKDVVPKGPGNRGGRRSDDDDNDSSDGGGGSAALRLLQGGNVRTSGGVAGTVQMPRNVVPASVRQSGPTQAQVQAMRDVPKFITKTRQVPITGSAGQKRNEQRDEQQAQRNALRISGGGTAALGVSASASGSLSLKPKAPTPQFRTETYQVPNPDYVEITVPAGPSPEQIKAARIAELRRIAEEQAAAEAARRAAVQQSANQNPAAALAYSQGKSHYTNPSTNALMPTTSISGKQRNTYGDSPRSEPVSGVSWWG